MLKLGAHLSIAGGYHKALDRIIDIGGNCLQIFSSSPRGWQMTKISPEDAKLFVEKKKKLTVDPVYFHASYLINLADDSRIGHLSKQSLINELHIASQIGIKGSIVHLGSFKIPLSVALFDISREKKYSVLINNILEVLIKTPKDSLFIIENAGNRKIGQTLEEIAKIIKDIDDERIKLCLDTCHLFSNGYKFDTNKEMDNFIVKLDKLSLLDKLELWHVNDSRDEFDSGRDRHANIGEGYVGKEEFQALLIHPKTKNFPFIIETPGFDNQGPDKKNLDILKSFIQH